MGLGNQGGGGNAGNKYSNHNNEHRQLRSIGAIAAAAAAGATELTLQMLLAAVQQGTEFEARLIIDDASVTWLEVRTWNTAGGFWNPVLYYPPGSSIPGSPVMPVVYVDNSTVLAMIQANTADNATQTTLALVLAAITTLSTPVTGLTATNLRVVGAGAAFVTAGNRRVSIANMGNTDATVAGATLKRGEVTTFVAGERDVLATITYDAETTELLISTVG